MEQPTDRDPEQRANVSNVYFTFFRFFRAPTEKAIRTLLITQGVLVGDGSLVRRGSGPKVSR